MILANDNQDYADITNWQYDKIESLLNNSCYDAQQREVIAFSLLGMTQEEADCLIRVLYNNQLPPFTHSDGGKTGIYLNPIEVINSRK